MFQTFTDTGKLQIDSNSLMYGFVQSGTTTATLDGYGLAYHFIESLSPYQILIGRCSGAGLSPARAAPNFSDPANPQGLFTEGLFILSGTANSTVTVEWWTFKQYSLFPDSISGMILYNSAGVKTFDSGYPPMRILASVPVTTLYDGMNEFKSVPEASGRQTAYASYGVFLRKAFDAPPTYVGSDTGFNALTGCVAHGTAGFYLRQLGNAFAGAWGFVDEDNYAGGILVVDVTGLSASGSGGGSAPSPTASISPSSQTKSAASGSQTFDASTVTTTNLTATDYTWDIVSPSSGTWSIASGQGTATATPQVTGVAASTTATATLRCQVTFNNGNSAIFATAPLSHQNTSSAAGTPTFSLAPGNYDEGVSEYTITASSAVTWTYTRSGQASRNTSTPASGTSSTTFTTFQAPALGGGSSTCLVTLTASWSGGSANWTIYVHNPGDGGGPVE